MISPRGYWVFDWEFLGFWIDALSPGALKNWILTAWAAIAAKSRTITIAKTLSRRDTTYPFALVVVVTGVVEVVVVFVVAVVVVVVVVVVVAMLFERCHDRLRYFA